MYVQNPRGQRYCEPEQEYVDGGKGVVQLCSFDLQHIRDAEWAVFLLFNHKRLVSRPRYVKMQRGEKLQNLDEKTAQLQARQTGFFFPLSLSPKYVRECQTLISLFSFPFFSHPDANTGGRHEFCGAGQAAAGAKRKEEMVADLASTHPPIYFYICTHYDGYCVRVDESKHTDLALSIF